MINPHVGDHCRSKSIDSWLVGICQVHYLRIVFKQVVLYLPPAFARGS